MSKIVILKANLSTPAIVDDLLDQVAANDPALAIFVANGLDRLAVIMECVEKAVNRIVEQPGIERTSSIVDYYGNSSDSYNGEKIFTAVKTASFSNGMGIIVAKDGKVTFVGDDYKSSWKQEMKRLQELFTDAYIAEASLAVMQIVGYEAEIITNTDENKIEYKIQGVKA